jgi:hypothetical protein
MYVLGNKVKQGATTSRWALRNLWAKVRSVWATVPFILWTTQPATFKVRGVILKVLFEGLDGRYAGSNNLLVVMDVVGG